MSNRTQFKLRIDQALSERSPRERAILVWGVVAGLLLTLIFGLWIPLQQAQVRLERSVAVERARLAIMSSAKLELSAIENLANQSSHPPLSRPLIEEMTRAQLSPGTLDVRMDGESRIKIVFTGAQMSKLAGWMDSLSKSQRIHVTFARLRPETNAISGELHFSGPDL
jgi:type II secretory pathway component PulM